MCLPVRSDSSRRKRGRTSRWSRWTAGRTGWRGCGAWPEGLAVLRPVAAGAPEWLAPGGHLLIETSERQAPLAVAVFAASGLAVRVATAADLNATVVIGAL